MISISMLIWEISNHKSLSFNALIMVDFFFQLYFFFLFSSLSLSYVFCFLLE
jgi:hypothetical protein